MGMAISMMNGGGSTNLCTIPSPSPMDKPPSSSIGAGPILAPPLTSNITGPEQQNMNEMVQSQQPYAASNMGMNAIQTPQQQNMGFPSPAEMYPTAPLQGVAGYATSLPQHHPQSMGQHQMMQGPLNFNPQATQTMMMQPAHTLQQQQPQVQQWVPGQMEEGQSHISQHSEGQMAQYQQQPQMHVQASQVPQSPQGNPFDMY
jgi:hypothetical protein